MTKKQILLTVLVISAVIQLSVPAYMMYKHEKILRQGTVVKFKCAPVDPYDAMRGKYVALGIEGSNMPLKNGDAARGQAIYVSVALDKDTGFGKMESASVDKPKTGLFFKASAMYAGSGNIQVELPFNRYYMSEESAPEAEKAYAEHNRRGKSDAYVAVRIKDGGAVLEDVYVGGKPIREFIKDSNK